MDILQQDSDVVVSVRAGLFMVESQSVEQLMLDGAVVQASLAGQRHHLLPTTTADVRPASGQDHRSLEEHRGMRNTQLELFMAVGSYPSLDSMLSQSRSLLLLGLKRIQEKEEKDSSPRVMMDFSREAEKMTPHQNNHGDQNNDRVTANGQT